MSDESKTHTLTGTFRTHEAVRSRYLDSAHDIIVYLPPGYDEDSERRYPVLYMQDGQNLFDPRTSFRRSSPDLRVTERFQRADANTILYRATIDDQSTYTKPWTIEYPFVATTGPVYEYACHEGNYAMPDILGGARKLEQEGRQ